MAHHGGVRQGGVPRMSSGNDNRNLYDAFGVAASPIAGLASITYSDDQYATTLRGLWDQRRPRLQAVRMPREPSWPSTRGEIAWHGCARPGSGVAVVVVTVGSGHVRPVDSGF